MFAPDELIAALTDGGVDYVPIGRLAVGAHGFPRATKHVDIVPAPDETNLARLADVLRELEARNYGTVGFDPAEFPFDPLNPTIYERAAISCSLLGWAASTSCSGCRVSLVIRRSST